MDQGIYEIYMNEGCKKEDYMNQECMNQEYMNQEYMLSGKHERSIHE